MEANLSVLMEHCFLANMASCLKQQLPQKPPLLFYFTLTLIQLSSVLTFMTFIIRDICLSQISRD